MGDIGLALLLTLAAGLSTGIGSLFAFFTKKTNTKFLAVSLGFSAGVMIYVSMIELFQEAQTMLQGQVGVKAGAFWTAVAFFGGMLLITLIDKLVPQEENPHDLKKIDNKNMGDFTLANEESLGDLSKCESKKKSNLTRMGIMTALAIAIHNFPEGLASFISALQSPSVGLPIVFAIAIHNIPEGISVAIPIYYGTGSRKKAVLYSFLSGLSEPLGAIIGYLILLPIMNDVVFGVLFAMVAGIMVFISLDELLPSAREYGENHLSIYGLVAGMVVMAGSLLLFM